MKGADSRGILTKRKPFQKEMLSLNSGSLDGLAGHLGAGRRLQGDKGGCGEQAIPSVLRWERESEQELPSEAGMKGK